jgi:hypothetical protein
MTDAPVRTNRTPAALVAAIMIALVGLVAVLAAADDRGVRLDRKIRVMEGVIDGVLIDSPNILVSPGGGITRGLALDGYGVLFTVDGRLNVGHVGGNSFEYFFVPGNELITQYQVQALEGLERHELEELDESVDEMRDRAEAYRRQAEERLQELKERQQEAERSREELEAERAEMVAALRTEIVDTLVDFGATLVELDESERVAIAVFLDEGALFLPADRSGRDGSRLVVGARMADLRRYAAGDLSRDDVIRALEVEVR